MNDAARVELDALVESGVLGWPSDPSRRAAFEELRAAGLIERHGIAGGVKLWRLSSAGRVLTQEKGTKNERS